MIRNMRNKLMTILFGALLCVVAFLSGINLQKIETVPVAHAATGSLVETWDISATNSDNVTANLYSVEGGYSLEIIGSGNMKDFTSSTTDDGWQYAPWYSSYRTSIINLNINDGVKTIGAYAFRDRH